MIKKIQGKYYQEVDIEQFKTDLIARIKEIEMSLPVEKDRRESHAKKVEELEEELADLVKEAVELNLQ